MTRNRLNEEDTTETNPYQTMILNKVYKDDIKTEQMIQWSILSDLIKYIDGILDMAPSLTVKIRVQTAQKIVSQFENRYRSDSRYRV